MTMLMKTDNKIDGLPPNWRNSVEGIVAAGKLIAEKREQLSWGDFVEWVEKDILLRRDTAMRLVRISQNKIISNPAYADKLPAEWVKLSNLAFLPDKKLLEMIGDGTVFSINKHTLRNLRAEIGNLRKAPSGSEEIKIPEGMTIEQVVRKGMELEKTIPSSKDRHRTISAKMKISQTTYLMAKKLIKMIDDGELGGTDKANALALLREINEKVRILPYRDKIDDLFKKVHGGKASDAGAIGSRHKKKIEAAFDKTLHIIEHTSSYAVNMEIPYYNKEKAEEQMRRVKRANDSLRTLIGKIRSKAND